MKIMDLAKDLGAAYLERAEREIDLERIDRELWKREMALTPSDGWPGKNAEQRDFEKNSILAADAIWSGLSEAHLAQRASLTLLNGAINAMEAERRGFEWEVRNNLVALLAGKAIERIGGPVEETAFDDVGQTALDEELFFEALVDQAPASACGLQAPACDVQAPAPIEELPF